MGDDVMQTVAVPAGAHFACETKVNFRLKPVIIGSLAFCFLMLIMLGTFAVTFFSCSFISGGGSKEAPLRFV